MRHSVAAARQTGSRFRLDSIRNQIVVFTVLAALVPSLITAVISYIQNREALQEKITRELVTTGNLASRGLTVWLKERLNELRAFASSYEVSDNLARRAGARPSRLGDYLSSLRERFGFYDELQVMDARGRVVASSARQTRPPIALPPNWSRTLETGTTGGLLSDPYWDEGLAAMVVTLVVPVEANAQVIGIMVARAPLAAVADELEGFADETAGRVYVVTDSGRLIADSRIGPASEGAPRLAADAVARLTARDSAVSEYAGLDGAPTVGSARPISGTSWLAVAEIPMTEAYRQVLRLRNVTFGVVSLLVVLVGALAYQLGTLIARPLDRLIRGAAQVAEGDFSVGLPPAGRGEVGYLTQVFNNMVDHLRTSQAELERLSITDGLTGLGNRRHLMERLGEELARAARHARPFSVLMVDVDHFKKFNDQHGHQAGDEVLRHTGSVLLQSTRVNDCAARYGGEEFLVLLSETPVVSALEVAERIRERIKADPVDGRKITVSIGVAGFPEDGESAEGVIGAADAALYEAKKAGRDRVVAVPKGRARTNKDKAKTKRKG